MNKTAIKNFAIWARVQLMEAAKQRAFEYGITEGGKNKTNVDVIAGRLLSPQEIEQRQQLITQIQQKGFTQVMEEAAYTWFNRFIALRFMEVNGYLPSKIRVFTDETGAFKPEILKQALSVELEDLDRKKVVALLDAQANEELYKYLLITQCNALSASLPLMFEKIENWTELLFPAALLRPGSVLERLVTDIPEEDWLDIEIIGWLYQYYISEKRDAVIDPLRGKVIKKEDIPAATQLFTTDWVVKYIVDNSLGRYWIERHPESKLAETLEFFVTPKDGAIPTVDDPVSPESISVFDPCSGSGHFLVYAFEVLMNIYRECGWMDRDAARSILENNLFGLDIDDRAGQLSYFAVMMKARKYDRRILERRIAPHVYTIQSSEAISNELIHYIADHDRTIEKALVDLRQAFLHAKDLGSITIVPEVDCNKIYKRLQYLNSTANEGMVALAYSRDADQYVAPIIAQADLLTRKYDIVVTNPPYLNRMDAVLKSYVNEQYKDFSADLFSVFIYRNLQLCKPHGYAGYMSPFVWMFIKSYEKLRDYIIKNHSFITLIQFEYSAYEEATVPICTFVLKKGRSNQKGLFFKLSDFKGGMEIQKQKTLEALHNKDCGYFFEAHSDNFSKIPGSPVAYWANEALLQAFESQQVADFGFAGIGMRTGDNLRFLRMWFEVASNSILLSCSSVQEQIESKRRWIPYNKGGNYRKWYGNNEYVVNWFNDGQEIKENTRLMYPYLGDDLGWKISNQEYYYKPGITWSGVTSGKNSFRAYGKGFIFDSGANGFFPVDSRLHYILVALLNSCVAQFLLDILNPTINTGAGTVRKIPVMLPSNIDFMNRIDRISSESIKLSTIDWDAFETSWDFQRHPLV
ncbi:MAG: BREX-1 system adenine-specific DNA-methyltransferase PglX [Spirochaetales bacterium]|nr:BREX-1 system adenine-specific DNA-methyltransferase PglX [Spirochaetales bacterium]